MGRFKAVSFLMFLSLLFINIPLSIELGYIRVYMWMLPFVAGWLLSLGGNYRGADRIMRTLVHHETKRLRTLIKGVVVLLILLVLFTLSAQSEKLAWQNLFVLAVSFLFAITYIKLLLRGVVKLRQFYQFALISLGIQIFFGMIQFTTGSDIGNVKDYFGEVEDVGTRLTGLDMLSRVKGTLNQPNVLGNFLVLLFPFIVLLNRTVAHWKRINIIILIVGIIVLAATLSRGSVAALLIQVIVLMLMRPLNIIRIAGVLLLFGAVGLLLFQDSLLGLEGFYGTLMKRFSSVADNASASFRIEMIKGAWQYFTEHPLEPVGYINSSYIWSDVKVALPSYWNVRVHNIFLVFLLEGGVIALGIFTWWFLNPIKYLVFNVGRMSSIQRACILSLVGLLTVFNIYLTPLGGDITQVCLLILLMNYVFVGKGYMKSLTEWR